jgi:hypothetical protein
MNINKKLITAVAAGVIGTESTALNFGSISNGLAAGSSNVVVNDDGVTATTYGASLAKVGATDTRGIFAISGGASLAYTVTLPASTTITDGSTTMTVGTFTTNSTSGGAGLTGTLGAGGTDTFYVGATLTVNSTNNPGTYSGTYTITAAYN